MEKWIPGSLVILAPRNDSTHCGGDANARSNVTPIRKQLNRLVETAHGKFADALEFDIAFDEIGERLRQDDVLSDLPGERLQS